MATKSFFSNLSAVSTLFEYLFYGSTSLYIYFFQCGNLFRRQFYKRQILTSTEGPHAGRVKIWCGVYTKDAQCYKACTPPDNNTAN